MGALHELWERYRERVAFYVVYIREAHPEDGWVVNANREQGIAIRQPATDHERAEVAATCALQLRIRIPVVVDTIGDDLARAYGALPDRLYLVGRDGRIAFQGDPGPMGFRPADLAHAIETELAGNP